LHEAGEPKGATVLKGHGFSRADRELLKVPALASEGFISAISNLPPGAKAQDSLALCGTLRQAQGRLQVVPFQNA
jgi:hypothetical protein